MSAPRVGYENRDFPDGRRELRVLYPNTALGVRHALLAVMDGVRALGLGEDLEDNVEIVLAEILNNVAEHGYSAEGEDLVELQIVSVDGRLSCAVRDNGPPMPAVLVDAARHPSETINLPEGGFGWFLIHILATDLSYTRYAGRNELRFDIRVDASVATM